MSILKLKPKTMNYFTFPGLRNQVYPIIGDIMQPITMAQTNQNEKVIRILNKVCCEFGITFEEIKRKSRFHKYRAPRQVAMYLLRELTTISNVEVGDIIGGYDHSTVIHACRVVNNEIDTNSEVGIIAKNILQDFKK